MSTLNFRPRFRFYTDLSISEIHEKLKFQIENNNPSEIKITNIMNHMVLTLPKDESKFWTPQMDINLEEVDHKVLVRCLIGPSPAVWTLFVFLYGTLGLVSLFGALIWFSNFTLGIETWAHYPVILSLIVGSMLYFSAQQAQYLSSAEMQELKLFLDSALGCDCFSLAIEG